jgi:thiamine biosynthesis protein ThiS
MAMNLIQITLNGGIREIQSPMNLRELLSSLGLEGRPVVVEINGQAVFPRDHAVYPIAEGAVIEIVTLAAGG